MKKFLKKLLHKFRKKEVKLIKREYKVGHNKVEDKIVSYFVTDAHDNSELETRPELIRFPVSQLYCDADQKQRAEEYADAMNKIQQAIEQTYENNKLVDLLKE